MSHPISSYEGLYYYPGASNDLTRWILDTPLPPTLSPRQITLYTLVVFPSDHRLDSSCNKFCKGCDAAKEEGDKIGLQLNTYTASPGFGESEKGRHELRKTVFPGCVIYLDPKIWTVQAHQPVRTTKFSHRHIYPAPPAYSSSVPISHCSMRMVERLKLVEINELPVHVALGTLHLGFVPDEEKNYGIERIGSNANVESFKKMTELLARQAMEAAFAEDTDA